MLTLFAVYSLLLLAWSLAPRGGARALAAELGLRKVDDDEAASERTAA